jgi:hypothetical protein
MNDIAQGQVWELFSKSEGRWVRAVVMKVEDDQVTLRFEGLTELVVVSGLDMQNQPDEFRPADSAEPETTMRLRRRDSAAQDGISSGVLGGIDGHRFGGRHRERQ